jgi:hypothetical protein
VISNRYVFDGGSGIAVAMAGLLFGLDSYIGTSSRLRRPLSWLIAGGLTVWILGQIYVARANAPPSPAISQAEIMGKLSHPYSQPKALPGEYISGEDLAVYGIPYNGAGWHKDGKMQAMIALFLDDPECLQLHLTHADQARRVDFANVRVKIGLELLGVESMDESGPTCVITFRRPKSAVYQQGLQLAFVGYVDRDNAASEWSPLRLLKVNWKR